MKKKAISHSERATVVVERFLFKVQQGCRLEWQHPWRMVYLAKMYKCSIGIITH